MKHCFAKILLLAAVSAIMVACSSKEDDAPSFSSSDLIGTWVVNDTTVFWRYDSGGSGQTWDTSEDVQEGDETTMRFTWSLSGDQLSHVFSGDEVHQTVAQDYTILELSGNKMRWNDGLKSESLTRVN